MKKTLAILAVAALGAALIGCGDKSAEGTDTTTGTTSTAAPATTGTAAPATTGTAPATTTSTTTA